MATILAAMSAGGLVGVSNQYMYLLLFSLAGRFGLLRLTAEMAFMTSDIFIGAVGVLWLISVAPSYLPLIAPGLANAANTISNIMHGFVVPASSALIALGSAGFVSMNPDAENALLAVQLFDPTTGAIEPSGLMLAGGAAFMGMTLTGSKFLAKPGVAAATGTTGHVSAPMFATVENLAAVVVMAGVYFLSQINPWFLVAFAVILAIALFVVTIMSVIVLYRVGKGIGWLFRLIERQPRAGWSLVAETLVWGSGSMMWQQANLAIPRLVMWAAWMLALALGTILWAVPIIGWAVWMMILFGGFGVGYLWARGLLKRLESAGHIAPMESAPRAVPAMAAT